MWDLQGQDRVVGGINRLFCKGASGALVVADITDLESIENAANWKKQIAEHVANQMAQFDYNNGIDEDDEDGEFGYGWGYNDAFDRPDEEEELDELDEDERYAQGMDDDEL